MTAEAHQLMGHAPVVPTVGTHALFLRFGVAAAGLSTHLVTALEAALIVLEGWAFEAGYAHARVDSLP